MRQTLRRMLLIIGVACLGAGVQAPRVGASGGPDPGAIAFYVPMGDCGLSGSAAAGSTFRIIVHDRSGDRLLNRLVTANSSGTWHADCIDGRFRGGEEIVARFDGQLRRLLVVPRLSMRIDRGANLVDGAGPTAGPASVHLVIDACLPGLITCRGGAVDVDVPTDPVTGRWLHPLGLFDTDGADNGRVVWTSTFGDVVQRRARTPYLEVRAGGASVRGFGMPGAALTVTLRSATGTLRATATATPAWPYGGWSGTFRRHGRRIRVRLGDRVRARFATDASLRVRDIPIAADTLSRHVNATCRRGGEYGVRWTDATGADQGVGYGTADPATGAWTVLAPGVAPGWTITAWCDDAAGDVVRRVFVVP